MLSPSDWANWAKQRAENWTQALSDALDDVRRAVSGAVEADPEEAQRRTQVMYDALFAGPDAPVPGLWARVGWLWAVERELGPEKAAALYEGMAEALRRAGQADARAEDLTGDALAHRAHDLTLAFIKDADYKAPAGSDAPGFAPIVVGGILVVGFLGACWAWVRSEQAKVELARTDNVRAGIEFYKSESAAGRTPSIDALAALMSGNAPPKPAPLIDTGGGGSWMVVGALGFAALLGVGFALRRGA